MLSTESSPHHRNFKAELNSEFSQTDINLLPPHQFYPTIVQFLAHGCPATVLLDFFFYHPDYQTLKRFMLRYPNQHVQNEVSSHEESRLKAFEKIIEMKTLYNRYLNHENVAGDQN